MRTAVIKRWLGPLDTWKMASEICRAEFFNKMYGCQYSRGNLENAWWWFWSGWYRAKDVLYTRGIKQ